MTQKRPDLLIQAEIADINREFLRLLTHPRLAAGGGGLGLDALTLECLQRLNAAELEELAATPLLLAEFNPFPGVSADAAQPVRMVAEADVPADWQHELSGFANRLLTFIWQATRHDRLLSAFCLGLDTQAAQRLSELSFIRISRGADTAVSCLRARLADHPIFWRDLVRALHSGSDAQRLAAQLAVIQLSVSDQWSSSRRSGGRSYL